MSLSSSSFSLASSDYFIPTEEPQRFTDSERGEGNAAPPGETSSGKLGTILGVATPTVLAIYGVILFQRLGFAVGQAGFIQSMMIFTLGYVIMTLTSLSLGAVATNGKVGKGGAYYLISRVLGPEFGGSIGVILYVATIFNTAFNIAGFVEALLGLLGVQRGVIDNVLPNTYAAQLAYGSAVLLFCLLVCLVGAQLFAKTSLVIAVALAVSIFSVIFSIIFRSPHNYPDLAVNFTGVSSATLSDNFSSGYTDGLDFIGVFGIVFPACTGFLAGAAMSGDLKDPSKSIPRGTLGAVTLTGIGYTILMVLIASSVTRDTLRDNPNFLQVVCVSPVLLAAGVFSATLSGALSNLIGASRLVQAIALDKLIPGLGWFTRTMGPNDEPIPAVLFSWVLVQCVLLIGDVNAIGPFVTLFFLLCYATTNLAVVGPSLASTPNWRPTFHYYRWWLSAIGAITCVVAMFLVQPVYASVSTVLCMLLWFGIFVSKPSVAHDWGDLSQALTFHQVRKHVLRLDSRHSHVKNWRPHILFLCDSPRSSFAQARFLNALKKGGIYTIGHVLPTDADSLGLMYSALQPAWQEFVDAAKLKAFTEFASAATVREGARQLMLTSGLGAVKCNTVVLGWPADESPAIPAGAVDGTTCPPSEDESLQFDSWLRSLGNAQRRQRRLQRLRPGKRRSQEPLMAATDEDYTDDSEEGSSPIERRLSILSPTRLPGPTPLRLTSSSEYVSMVRDANMLGKNTGIGRHWGKLAAKLRAAKDAGSSRVNLSGDHAPLLVDLWPLRPEVAAAAALAPRQYLGETTPEAFASRFGMGAASMRNVSLVLQMGVVLSKAAALRPVKLRVFAVVESEATRTSEENRLRSFLHTLRIDVSVVRCCVASDYPDAFPAVQPGEAPPTFASLNGQEQCTALNAIVRAESRDATIVLVTMPPCPPTEDASLDRQYVQALDNLTRDLPPVLLLASGPESTVTTAI